MCHIWVTTRLQANGEHEHTLTLCLAATACYEHADRCVQPVGEHGHLAASIPPTRDGRGTQPLAPLGASSPPALPSSACIALARDPQPWARSGCREHLDSQDAHVVLGGGITF